MHVTCEGVQLWVDVSGPKEGRPVLLLHGFPDNHSLWKHQIKFLSEASYLVIAPDLVGFGQSEKPKELDKYKTENIVKMMCSLLDALQITAKVTVVGHDWGAAVAWQLAFTQAHRVEKLVVLSVGYLGSMMTADPRQRELSWYMLFYIQPNAEEYFAADDWAFARMLFGKNCKPEAIEQYIEHWKAPGALTAGFNVYRANIDLASFALTKPAMPPAPLDFPVLGIWSDQEAYLTEKGMLASEAVVAPGKWRYEKIEGAGHWMMRDSPDKVNQLLGEFLKS